MLVKVVVSDVSDTPVVSDVSETTENYYMRNFSEPIQSG